MNLLFSPTGFLKTGGAVLLILGLLGFTGVTNSIEAFNLDQGENVAHAVLGIVGLAVAFGIKDVNIHRYLTILLAVTGYVFGIWGFLLPAGSFTNGNFYGLANLENPLDNLLHLVVGVWATAAVYLNKGAEMMPAASRG